MNFRFFRIFSKTFPYIKKKKEKEKQFANSAKKHSQNIAIKFTSKCYFFEKQENFVFTTHSFMIDLFMNE